MLRNAPATTTINLPRVLRETAQSWTISSVGLERPPYTRRVAGSSPASSTENAKYDKIVESRGSSEVEHFSEKEGVVGALPTRGTKVILNNCGSSSVVERFVANEKIAGSIPVSRSKNKNKIYGQITNEKANN